MDFRLMSEADISSAVSLYIEYYNEKEDGQWTETTARKRIRQVLGREDSYCLLLEDNGELVAFAMGYFEQYDDGQAYDLVEIVVSGEQQNKGIGTLFMTELEKQVKEKGALLIQFQAVNDAHHEHFYGKLGYKTATNLVLKTKML